MKKLVLLVASVVLAGSVQAALFSDDFSTDTSGNYIQTRTYGSGTGSMDISGGTMNVTGAAGTTWDVFHNTARLEIGETVSVDLTAGANNIYLVVSTTSRAPNTAGESGIRLSWTGAGLFWTREYSNGAYIDNNYFGGTVAEGSPFNFYITRTADTVYTAGYDAGGALTGELTGISIPGTAGQGLHIGVETWDGGTRNFDNLMIIPEPATLGMVALFGGGILFIRRKLMI